jgi:hypothetical protein
MVDLDGQETQTASDLSIVVMARSEAWVCGSDEEMLTLPLPIFHCKRKATRSVSHMLALNMKTANTFGLTTPSRSYCAPIGSSSDLARVRRRGAPDRGAADAVMPAR